MIKLLVFIPNSINKLFIYSIVWFKASNMHFVAIVDDHLVLRMTVRTRGKMGNDCVTNHWIWVRTRGGPCAMPGDESPAGWLRRLIPTRSTKVRLGI